MRRMKPSDILGPRAYFTSFDPRLIRRFRNKDVFQKNLERKLKVLLLLKPQVICPASHLRSPVAYKFFRSNSFLLEDGYILPALRNDKSSFDEAFEKIKVRDKHSIINFYEDSVQHVVEWKLEDNSPWFKNQIIQDLEDENSVVRRNLVNITSKDRLDEIVNEIKKHETLSREYIDLAVENLPLKAQKIILNFRELLYHVFGARSVNSESALPQENYIDYDLIDLSQRRTKLSEENIFWKLFLEMAFDTFQKRVIPIEIIDLLSFRDILAIGEPLQNSSFRERYDQLVNKAIQLIQRNDTEDILLDAIELYEIRKEIELTFRSVFEQELQNYLKIKLQTNIKQILGNTSSVALGVAGLVPGIGTIASAVGILKDSPAVIVNLGETYTSIKSLQNFDIYLEKKKNTLRQTIEISDISDKATMLEMVDLLANIVSEKIKL